MNQPSKVATSKAPTSKVPTSKVPTSKVPISKVPTASRRRERYSLVIFDWDGTVVNSIPHIVTALQQAAHDVCYPLLSDTAYQQVIGLNLSGAVQALYPNVDESGVLAYIDAYRHRFRQLDRHPPKPFPGALRGLQQLKQQGVTLAVATGKSRAGLQRSMDANGLTPLIDLSKTSDEAPSKPDPDMLEQILQELGVDRKRALMVGDSCFDLQMAQNAGIDRVAVSYGAQSESALERFQPLHTAHSFDDFINWLELDKLPDFA